ncbi:4-hydroxythreonine-4-phosphate dehydrogenase PdxA [Flavobacterium sp. xlx-214]|uniref:4-hydroxythreonine-4-phosphate dehydrogenase PdxA n=1 Tax=unclassified Flavobacterium TaxID=196869 RepID=UPI0013D84857|nr:MULTISPECIES: 4-hydroxythreonine-4-phosphate dehydrogenase PdxA [unclassified Flavobacterium]MBA5793014.1 4-hydroxythreonine-4-phosphate dehydrogenase PdxA [Flavobacterium sp. xlx-221]QMI84658.1 4-hydroxythreonine-4-phosphate dehydrogenase PdxA [Flavobacterium sp. xlx-214]
MFKKGENIVLGISIGDMNGVGPEVILKTFEDPRMMELCTPVVFGNVKLLSFLKKNINCTTVIHGIDSLDQIQLGKFNVLNLWKEGVNLDFGVLDDNVGKYAIKSFAAATQALKDDLIDALVTAPINKYNIQSDDFKFPGHTDYLNQELEGNALMFMISDDLKVGLLTDHVPLQEVSAALNPELIKQKVRTINKSLIQDFNAVKPRIALLGLNPHSGDNGIIGTEEQSFITQTVKELFDENIIIYGPYSADAFFGAEQYKNFDAVVACYHDQGLIPFKALNFGNGVNFTAGLNKIRTSPDHGTAYDIAGKGIADFTSFKNAVYAALDIYKNKNEYLQSIKNPLKVSSN